MSSSLENYLKSIGVNPNLAKSVEEIEFSGRAQHCFINMGVSTLFDLVLHKEKEVLKVKNLGRRTLNEIKEVLEGNGLHLDMNFDREKVDRIKAVLATGKPPQDWQNPESDDAADKPSDADPPATRSKLFVELKESEKRMALIRMGWEKDRQTLKGMIAVMVNGVSVSVTDSTPLSLRRFMEKHGPNLTVEIVEKHVEDLNRQIEAIDLVTRRRNDKSSYLEHVIEALKLCDE